VRLIYKEIVALQIERNKQNMGIWEKVGGGGFGADILDC
jgi:hypothetical protein